MYFDSEWSDDSKCAAFSLTSGTAAEGVWAVIGVAGLEVTGCSNEQGAEEQSAQSAATRLARKGKRWSVDPPA